VITKREVLKESAKVFDPLGLLSPVTVKAKIFMQSLWQCSLDWDEPLSDKDQQQWLETAEKTSRRPDVYRFQGSISPQAVFQINLIGYTFLPMRVSQLMEL